MHFKKFVATAAAVLAGLLAAGGARAELDPAFYGPRLVAEEVRVAAPGGYEIATTILRPEGKGPFGAVVLNHGVAGSDEERAHESSEIFLATASVFARRGYVVVMPLRRGFGATGGEMAEDAGPCRNPDYTHAEQNAADDVMAAYEYARKLPYVDGNRMILAGQSGGGIVSIVTAARHPQGLQAVLSFAGGRGGNPDLRPGVPCAVEAVARVFDMLGKEVKVPVLFNYAANDQYFNEDTSRFWFSRFTQNGGNGEYVLQPAFGKDGHYLFSDLVGVRYWLPTVERFFGEHKIAFQRLDSADPAWQPLLAVAKVPNVKSESCRALYRVFLESPGPRAYAVSDDGRCGFAGNVRDANKLAMKQCKRASGADCQLYAVDGEVVWKQPAQPDVMQAASKPAPTASMGATEKK